MALTSVGILERSASGTPCRMCLFDIFVVDTYAASYDGIYPHKILSRYDQRKKGKYLEACLERQHQFTSLVLSTGGEMGEETKLATNQLASAL